MTRQAALSVLTVAVLLIGAWNVQSTSHAATDATPGKAYFAGGCFWCMEEAFEKVEGVLSATSGYMGGKVANPSYEEVSAGRTGHAESVEVIYDPSKVSYQKLLDAFWHNVDPVTPNAQFCDHGSQYRSVIFYLNEEQKKTAEEVIAELRRDQVFRDPIVTAVEPASTFYVAEDYHQDYFANNAMQPYCMFVVAPKVQKIREKYAERLKA